MRRREFLLGGAAAVWAAGCGVGPQSAPKVVAQPVVKPEIDGDQLIFNWTEYMNPKVIRRFEKHHGVKLAGLEHLDERYVKAVGYATKSRRNQRPRMVLIGDEEAKEAG